MVGSNGSFKVCNYHLFTLCSCYRQTPSPPYDYEGRSMREATLHTVKAIISRTMVSPASVPESSDTADYWNFAYRRIQC